MGNSTVWLINWEVFKIACFSRQQEKQTYWTGWVFLSSWAVFRSTRNPIGSTKMCKKKILHSRSPLMRYSVLPATLVSQINLNQSWTGSTERSQESCQYLGHAGHASHQQHLSDVSLGHLGILHGLLAGGHGAANQVGHNTLELRAGQLHVQVFGSRGVHGQVGEVDVRLGSRGTHQRTVCVCVCVEGWSAGATDTKTHFLPAEKRTAHTLLSLQPLWPAAAPCCPSSGPHQTGETDRVNKSLQEEESSVPQCSPTPLWFLRCGKQGWNYGI